MPTAKLISITPDYMQLLKRAAGQCYQTEANDKVIQHIIEAGHLSVLEHCTASFEVTCSISVLLQLTRHRHLSFTVQSSRGSELNNFYVTGKNAIDVSVVRRMESYHDACMKTSCEDAAYLLPKAAEYKLVVTGNFRAWFEYLPKRLCKRAQREHRDLATLIYVELAENAPEIFSRNMKGCEKCTESRCEFKA